MFEKENIGLEIGSESEMCFNKNMELYLVLNYSIDENIKLENCFWIRNVFSNKNLELELVLNYNCFFNSNLWIRIGYDLEFVV